ncbi:MAG: dockerin type I repeat-containing protein [Oscillospiraceae bacterium]|nr:dockerin type I repeat-containing protein [Oscillospiraceae bacterium]
MMKQTGKWAAFLAALLFTLTSVPLTADAAGSKEDSAAIAQSGYIINYGEYWIDTTGLKTTYRIGEELDLEGLMNAPLYGSGSYEYDGETYYWDAFGDSTLGSRVDYGSMKLNTSNFDNTKPGQYRITFSDEEGSGSVTVKVIDDADETTVTETGFSSEESSDTDKSAEAVSTVKGDIDLSGSTTIGDAVLFSRYLAEDTAIAAELTEQGLENADMDGDGFHTAKDLSKMLKVLALVTDEPVEEQTTAYTETMTDAGNDETTTAYNGEEVWNGFISIWRYNEAEYPVKWVYRLGEDLDLSNMILYGGGSISGGGSWDLFPPGGEAPTFLTESLSWIEIDDSEFDNTKPGIYTIYMKNKYHPDVTGSFEVMVAASGGEIWADDNGSWKNTYLIGEELDILDAPLYGSGIWYDQVYDGEWEEYYWDAFGEDTLGFYVNEGFLELDTSGFDNTKPGTYTIYMRFTNSSAEGSIEVTVVDSDVSGAVTGAYTDWCETDDCTGWCETDDCTGWCETGTCTRDVDFYETEPYTQTDDTSDKTIRYKLVAHDSPYVSTLFVLPGEHIPIDLVVSNDQGTAGARLYLDFDERLKLGRTSKGTAYDASFQWGSEDRALVWTCKDGRNQTAEDGAVIYSFLVTVPEDAKPGEEFRIGLNQDRLADMSVRSEKPVTEEPDLLFSLDGILLCNEVCPVCESEAEPGIPEGEGEYWLEDDGSWKSEYLVGEELDIMKARLYGEGTDYTSDANDARGYSEVKWMMNGASTLFDNVAGGFLTVDASEFDNTKPGKYNIYLRDSNSNAAGVFVVNVFAAPGEIRVHREGSYKTLYQIGEELDIMNAQVTIYETNAFDDYGVSFSEPLKKLIDDGYLTADTSEFDNTKPGTYQIRLSYKTGDAKCSFEVRVMDDGECPGITVRDDSGYQKKYVIGEELNIGLATVMFDEFDNDEFLPLEDLVRIGYLEVDTSEFDNTKPGTYTIYLRYLNGYGKGSFTVKVYADAAERDKDRPSDIIYWRDRGCQFTYRIGDELNIMGLSVALDDPENEKWSRHFLPLSEFVSEGLVTVDASAFDNTKTGTYPIRLIYIYKNKAAECSFEVYVVDEDFCNEITVYEGFRQEYRIGEALDLNSVSVYIPILDIADGPIPVLVGECGLEVDASEFDNTKPGTYTIRLHCPSVFGEGSFTVTVKAD